MKAWWLHNKPPGSFYCNMVNGHCEVHRDKAILSVELPRRYAPRSDIYPPTWEGYTVLYVVIFLYLWGVVCYKKV